jgi:hypothetical protein
MRSAPRSRGKLVKNTDALSNPKSFDLYCDFPSCAPGIVKLAK